MRVSISLKVKLSPLIKMVIILRYYVLDPSKIHDVSSGDVGNAKVTDVYTLVYEKNLNKIVRITFQI